MFVRDCFGNLIFVPRTSCFAEDEGAAEGGGSAAGEGEAAGAAAEGAGKQQAAEGTGAAGGEEGAAEASDEASKGKAEEADWRAGLTDPELKKFADRSPDLDHLIKRAKEANDRLSKAIVPPGKDASEEDIAAYRKQIGVPAKADGYKFEMPGDREPSENDKAFHGTMAEAFHSLNITKDQAKGLNEVWNKMTEEAQQAQAKEDELHFEEGEADLKRRWGKDFEVNNTYSVRAMKEYAGDKLDEFGQLQLSNGRFVADHPLIREIFATAGREMAEGGPAPKLDGEAREQAQDELRSLQEQIEKAQQNKDHKRANELYQKKLALTAKVVGNKPIVGSGGRAA